MLSLYRATRYPFRMTVLSNTPVLWKGRLPVPLESAHKYDRGCVVVFAGESMTGAARLVAEAAMRAGAGICVVVAPKSVAAIYRASLPAHIIVENLTSVADHLADPRRNAVVIGPGMAASPALADAVLAVLGMKRSTVLDAGALTAYEDAPDTLLTALHNACVLTPHDGEFTRIFKEIGRKPPVDKAVDASAISGCTVLLKGRECVVAAPGHDPALLREAAPYLATAGSGDVLAGVIAGLMAQGMTPYDSGCAGAWLHRKAGQIAGRGLVASDLPALIPVAWNSIGGI